MSVNTLSVYDLMCRNADTFGARTAWIETDVDRTVTHAELHEAVARLAAGLQAAGVTAGDRIGAVGRNSLQLMLLFGAAAAVGAILVPVNWRLSADEIRYALNDTEPRLVFADEAFQSMLLAMDDQLLSVRAYFALSGGSADFLDFDSLMAPPDPEKLPVVGLDDGVLIIHTAAVGGRPRGALLSHGNLLWSTLQLSGYLGLGNRDVHLNLLPMFHVAGLFTIMTALQAGAATVNMARFDAVRAVALIAKHRVSCFFNFAPILEQILDTATTTGQDIGSLQQVLGLDAPAIIRRFQAVTGGIFHVLYGQTETSAVVAIAPFTDGPGSAGRPTPVSRIGIMGEKGRLLDPGQVGEIVVRGPLVFKGYWNRVDDTRLAMRNDWLHTGDLGRFDDAGYLFFEGRTADKELIKTGGENVYPAEVELALCEHPQVAEAVVFGVSDDRWQEAVRAVVLPESGQVPAANDLKAFVAGRIARFKRPRDILLVDRLPRTADGSIDRDRVKADHGDPAA